MSTERERGGARLWDPTFKSSSASTGLWTCLSWTPESVSALDMFDEDNCSTIGEEFRITFDQ